MTEPKIRFKRFDGEWINYSFQDFICPAGEKNRDNLDYESYSITNESGFVPQNEKFVNGGTMKNADKRMYYIIQPNTFAYNPARINVGSIGFQNLNSPVIVSSLYVLFKTTDACNDPFLSNWFKTSLFSKQVLKAQEGGVRLYFFYDKLKNSSINLPSFKEQQAIADFFQSLDSIISTTSKKIEKLKQTLTGCMQTMFPQEGELEPKIRFKGFEGKWKKVILRDCLEISNERNKGNIFGKDEVLSVSDDYGVMNQIKLLGRSYAGVSVENYKILRKDQIVYTKSPLKLKPYGIIKVNKSDVGIVSVLYAVYNVKEGVDPDFIHFYFEPSYRINNYLLPLISKGAKHTMNISDDNVLNGYILIPSKDEQSKIANYFNSLNKMISFQSKRLNLLKHIKSACLDNMFV